MSYKTTFGTNEPNYLIIVVTFIILFTFFVIFLIFFFQNIPNKQLLLECEKGKCATNIFSGEKRCAASNDETVLYDPSFEVCNSRFACENSQTPYALLPNGSTNIMGICAEGHTCRCLKNNTCAKEIVTAFDTSGSKDRTTFDQISLNIQGSNGAEQFIIDDQNTQFCSIKTYHLDRISPGACTFTSEDDITLAELQKCYRDNPCLIGVLAFYPHNFNSFVLNKNNKDAIYNITSACIASSNNLMNNSSDLKNYCDPGSVPVYNNGTGLIQCYETGFD